MEQIFTINIDMDDVLNDLSKHWYNIHLEASGEKLSFDCWGVHKSSKFGKGVYDYFTMDDFFLNCPPKKDLEIFTKFLKDNTNKFNVRIVSHCMQEKQSDFEYIEEQKIRWIKEHMGEEFVDNFILTISPKHLFDADIVIDDKVDNLHGYIEPYLPILVKAKHNEKISVDDIYYDYGIKVEKASSFKKIISLVENYTYNKTPKEI